MWTYDGSYPGPTIRRPAGEPTTITFRHQLPAKVGELTSTCTAATTAPTTTAVPAG